MNPSALLGHCSVASSSGLLSFPFEASTLKPGHSDAALSLGLYLVSLGASLVAQMVKNLPAMQETRVQSLGWENPLEKGMATHSSILAWGIPWIEEPGGLQAMG